VNEAVCRGKPGVMTISAIIVWLIIGLVIAVVAHPSSHRYIYGRRRRRVLR
jgi:hypothetical protein